MNSFFGIPMMIPSRQLSDCDKGGWQTTQNVACVLPQVQYRTKGSVFPGQYVRYSEETTQKVNYPDFFRRWRQRSRFILIPFLIQQLRVMACNISQVGQVQPLLKLSDSTVHFCGTFDICAVFLLVSVFCILCVPYNHNSFVLG